MHRPTNYCAKTGRVLWFLKRRMSDDQHRNAFAAPSKLADFWKFSGKADHQQQLPASKSSLSRAYEIVKPGKVSERRTVHSHIVLPPYVSNSSSQEKNHQDDDGGPSDPRRRQRPETRTRKFEIKTLDQVDRMREAGKLARKMMNIAVQSAKVGVTTDELDAVVHEAILEHGAYPSPLLYRRFPKSICTSVNNVVCHGIPDDRPLKDGDIITIDITVYLNGYHGDCAETIPIGTVDDAGIRLIEGARACRDAAIKACGPGQPLSNIGAAISILLNSLGYKVVPTFCGHGIGSYFHGPPDIFHFANHLLGKMEPGMTFTIEPVITEGSERFVILNDGWTAATVDDSRGAQFEHTILITNDGVEILTK